MPPNLAQVLNTLAHEIRTPLAVSQGYLKLFLDGRLTNADDTRRAMEQTRQALGALATYCVDMGKISALSERAAGVPTPVPAAEFVANLQTLDEVKGVAWDTTAIAGAVRSVNAQDLAHAVAITAKAVFDENRDAPHTLRVTAAEDLVIVGGGADRLAALQEGPAAPTAKAMDFAKGGKGLKLIWAAFVLETQGVHTWTDRTHRDSIGFRIPMVNA